VTLVCIEKKNSLTSDSSSLNYKLTYKFYFFFLATISGLELIPYILGIVISSIGSGQFVSRTDKFAYRTISAAGAVLITVGVVLITLWDENTGRAAQVCYMIIAGLGVGCKIL
jgi:hypothetical protein